MSGGDGVALVGYHRSQLSGDCILDFVYPSKTHDYGLGFTPVEENNSCVTGWLKGCRSANEQFRRNCPT
jgi:hypothetical protein